MLYESWGINLPGDGVENSVDFLIYIGLLTPNVKPNIGDRGAEKVHFLPNDESYRDQTYNVHPAPGSNRS